MLREGLFNCRFGDILELLWLLDVPSREPSREAMFTTEKFNGINAIALHIYFYFFY
jgi:hypothetical protein